MTPLETLGITLASGVTAAVVAAITTLLVEGRKHGYEDRIRFIDLRRERYSVLLREADEHVRTIKRQYDAVLEFVANDAPTINAPPLGSTDPLSHLAAEISLLARKPDVGAAAQAVYEALVNLDRFAWNASDDPENYIRRSDEPMDEALAVVDAARTRFLAVAKADLG